MQNTTMKKYKDSFYYFISKVLFALIFIYPFFSIIFRSKEVETFKNKAQFALYAKCHQFGNSN